MTVVELKRRLEQTEVVKLGERKEVRRIYLDALVIKIRITKSGAPENAQMPEAIDVDGTRMVLFEPESWH